MSVEWDPKFDAQLDDVIRKKLTNIVRRIARKVDDLFRLPKSGRFYGKHQASAPGEAPGIETAALRKSVTTSVQKVGDSWAGDVGPSLQSGRAEIASMLEFGTSNIEPRPAWRPALEAVIAEEERVGSNTVTITTEA